MYIDQRDQTSLVELDNYAEDIENKIDERFADFDDVNEADFTSAQE